MIHYERVKCAVHIAFKEHQKGLKDSRDEFNYYLIHFIKVMYGSLWQELYMCVTKDVDMSICNVMASSRHSRSFAFLNQRCAHLSSFSMQIETSVLKCAHIYLIHQFDISSTAGRHLRKGSMSSLNVFYDCFQSKNSLCMYVPLRGVCGTSVGPTSRSAGDCKVPYSTAYFIIEMSYNR